MARFSSIEDRPIAQALLAAWKEEKAYDVERGLVYGDAGCTVDLERFLRYYYKDKYVMLCWRIGVEPLTFGEWLTKPVSSLL